MNKKCKKCGSKNIVMVEYGLLDIPDAYKYYYDGISEIDCKDCGARFGRWTGNLLKDGELEPRYGKLKQ